MWSVFSIKTKRTHTDQRNLQVCKSSQKEMSHKPSKLAAAKNFCLSVYIIGTACFDECF